MNSKAQAWFMDFAIALLLFTFTLVIYFSYTTNFQKQEKGELEPIISDAKAISSSLALSGYPANWDNTTVIRIGIADEQKVNATKLKSFKQLDYSATRKKFATVYDYFVFFVNDKGEVLNINGVCGIGIPDVNVSYNIKSAYYYSDEDDSFLRAFMNDTFKADIYFGNQIDKLISNLSKYGFLVLEHPLMSTSTFNQYKSNFENYTSNGGLLMISGELAAAQGKNMVGVDFYKKSGQSSSQRTAIVNNTDPYLALAVGQSMVFDQYYYVENQTASEFKIIATFNQSDDKAIAKWKYYNGTVYFFSDFDVYFFNGNFINVVEDLSKSFVEGTCTSINITSANLKKLVKTERYLNYNSKVVKMVVYVWQ
ncbi:hypothetical protein HYX03_03365 [Candidatus Woesearchaeota archaeon]|nr:hypothetical protein [Candidatus Woesearchaeota archaeon]